MKKHDEGYILAYVTVVLLIFCLVATVILTGALRNFQNQQNTIAQMKDQYAAEGMIEQVVAKWNTISWSEYTVAETPIGTTGVLYMGKEDDAVILSATSGTVTITCQVKDGKYIFYEVGTAAPTEPEEVPE